MVEGNSQNPGCLGAILRIFGIRAASGPSADSLPYRMRDDFLSKAELSFYRVLHNAVDGRAVICPKVNLCDVFFVVRPNENMAARGRISQKHVDFLLCESDTLRPVLGLELDDSSHARQDRQQRDELVDSVFQAAGLPLLHIQVRSSYSVGEIAAQLAPFLRDSGRTVPVTPPVAVSSADGAPVCPKCGVQMVLRTAGRGARQGGQFYGCVNYPKCRETVQLG
ncbi:MAG: DUF2726 domain-containing protein [Coriobacteriia bacterium]|nr:DUF2726 domain-containing protein [Coriobacteriia bacterium]